METWGNGLTSDHANLGGQMGVYRRNPCCWIHSVARYVYMRDLPEGMNARVCSTSPMQMNRG